MADKKYKFNRPSDRVVTTVSAAAGLAALGGGLALAFNPVAIAVAGGVVLGNQLGDVGAALWKIPAYKKWAIKQYVKQGRWSPVPEDAPISRITTEISNQLGRPKPPEIYTVDSKTVAKLQLPFGLRWVLKSKKMSDKVMPSIFMAAPGTNTMITTKEALNNGQTEEQLRFIAAHEVSHLQAKDHLSPAGIAGAAIKKTARTLFWCSAAALGASLFGVTLPVFAAPAALAMAVGGGAYIAAKVINNFGKRTVERRADRNALYITRDLEGAKSGLASADMTLNMRLPRLKELFCDHAFYKHRVKIMAKDFKKVSKLPLLQAPKQSAAPAQP